MEKDFKEYMTEPFKEWWKKKTHKAFTMEVLPM